MADDNGARKSAVFSLCFADQRSFNLWLKGATSVQCRRPPPFTYCEDCNRGYQWQMLLTNRCENPAANPE